MATEFYNEVVRVFNCRISGDGCDLNDKVENEYFFLNKYALFSQPSVPWCVKFAADEAFSDVMQAEFCRADVQKFGRDLEGWVLEESEGAVEEARRKADSAVVKFNCYASGNEFCF